jgi:dTDP-4-amino-4,6-dideoxygalactose transaminase
VAGYNSRLDEIQAAMLSVKLRHLEKIVSHKRLLADIYFSQLPEELIVPSRASHLFDSFHIFNVRTNQRDLFREHLLRNGVRTEIHYPVAPTKQKAMAGVIDHFACPIAEEIHRTTLSLPISYFHQPADIERVCEVAASFFS